MFVNLRAARDKVRMVITHYKERQDKARKGEAGQGLVEYALIILFVAIALVLSVQQIAPPLITILNNAASML